MPDWTYQTVFRPALLALGPRMGRGLAFGFMGGLARLPGGKTVIRLMGHMRPDDRIALSRGRLRFSARTGLGCALDPTLAAAPALAEFGFGYLEVGPVVLSPPVAVGPVAVDRVNESIRCAAPLAALSPVVARDRLRHDGPFRLPILARIHPDSREQAREMIAVLREVVDGFVVPAKQLDHVLAVAEEVEKSDDVAVILFAAVDAASWKDDEVRQRCEAALAADKLEGVIVVVPIDDGAQQLGKTGFTAAVDTVEQVRATLGAKPTVIGSVGVHSPADALDCLEAGADLVQLDTGLVFAGPGLPKRINEAVLYRQLATDAPLHEPLSRHRSRIGGESWFWALAMGLSMLLGGALAMLVATTRVVLPYDEAMAGLSREQLAQINERLLSFMTHDRVTLSGTMLAVGVLYSVLAWWGVRRGVHWAYLSVVVSALCGFISFFSFLGFGYFDPFHAFVTAVLFQMLLLTVHSHLGPRRDMEPPDLWNDARWIANQWGQLAFVVHGAILIAAGAVISCVGMTSVFVPEDLEFMHTTSEHLFSAHPTLVPLVAHDRATFGGMLLACGFATLLPAVWGFRRGQAWLWWALMIAGDIAYIATIAVHWTVGYHALMHLLPAYGGLALLWLGGLASYAFLVAGDARLDEAWRRRLERAA
ncbi:MAG: hypothetical protein RIC55_37095 [Pirellulaceae bacterium]